MLLYSEIAALEMYHMKTESRPSVSQSCGHGHETSLRLRLTETSSNPASADFGDPRPGKG